LLDANLSPRVGKFLSTQFDLEVKSIRRVGLEALPDHEVVRMAHREQRVIITLDEDFATYFHRQTRPFVGIIHLDLPIALRFIPSINRILHTFFTEHAETVELERSLVILTGESVRILRHPDAEIVR
jgi:predicted nuclease of predicted toxin-antitoxin system